MHTHRNAYAHTVARNRSCPAPVAMSFRAAPSLTRLAGPPVAAAVLLLLLQKAASASAGPGSACNVTGDWGGTWARSDAPPPDQQHVYRLRQTGLTAFTADSSMVRAVACLPAYLPTCLHAHLPPCSSSALCRSPLYLRVERRVRWRRGSECWAASAGL